MYKYKSTMKINMSEITPTPETKEPQVKFKYERPHKKLPLDKRQEFAMFLRENCFPSTSESLPAQDGLIFWLQNKDRELVATLLLKDNSIWNVCTGEYFRRQGFGEFLIQKLQKWWKNRYPDQPLILYVYKTNDAAIALYKKLGFKINPKYVEEPDTFQMVYT